MLAPPLTITVLGCGASGGVPVMGCNCAVCTSGLPRNNRTRVSILVQSATTTILVDTPPDLRQQALRERITKVDAIIYTHAHADHLHGIDDVRSFNFANDAPLPAYGEQSALDYISTRFGYAFLPGKPHGLMWYRPALVATPVVPYQSFIIGDIPVLPIEQRHGQGASLGLRFGRFAYSTDTNGLSDRALDALSGIERWVVDCLRYHEAPTHAHLPLTLEWIARVKPGMAYLTHMNHEFDYDTLCGQLPKGVLPAYDGLKFEV